MTAIPPTRAFPSPTGYADLFDRPHPISSSLALLCFVDEFQSGWADLCLQGFTRTSAGRKRSLRLVEVSLTGAMIEPFLKADFSTGVSFIPTAAVSVEIGKGLVGVEQLSATSFHEFRKYIADPTANPLMPPPPGQTKDSLFLPVIFESGLEIGINEAIESFLEKEGGGEVFIERLEHQVKSHWGLPRKPMFVTSASDLFIRPDIAVARGNAALRTRAFSRYLTELRADAWLVSSMGAESMRVSFLESDRAAVAKSVGSITLAYSMLWEPPSVALFQVAMMIATLSGMIPHQTMAHFVPK